MYRGDVSIDVVFSCYLELRNSCDNVPVCSGPLRLRVCGVSVVFVNGICIGCTLVSVMSVLTAFAERHGKRMGEYKM